MNAIEDWFESQSTTVTAAVLAGGNKALVVRPITLADDAPAPAVLWLHWLGHNRNDCSQFLAEAVALAGRGVISVLPQGTFPWSRRPQGTLEDVVAVTAELERIRTALAYLRAQPAVSPDRIAIVGHDYGAMYALALRDDDVRLVIAAAPDSSWPHWFLKYWPAPAVVDSSYQEEFERFDPLLGAAHLGSRLVLQWAEDDDYVPRYASDLYSCAAPESTARSYPYDHELGDAAVADRLALLRDALGIA
ncbi:hypothetical protein GCM10009795_005200 [Nocardioides hankookensis]|uniref:Alpha/beta hydrolase family protein n=1 Tax=Nocardioides hankookensis TaxID=443157 RepID=A0ABW1LM66_9ACTN